VGMCALLSVLMFGMVWWGRLLVVMVVYCDETFGLLVWWVLLVVCDVGVVWCGRWLGIFINYLGACCV